MEKGLSNIKSLSLLHDNKFSILSISGKRKKKKKPQNLIYC